MGGRLPTGSTKGKGVLPEFRFGQLSGWAGNGRRTERIQVEWTEQRWGGVGADRVKRRNSLLLVHEAAVRGSSISTHRAQSGTPK